MLKTLVKKQLAEVFRSYFVNTKKNTARSKAGMIGMFVMFGAVMILLMGGMFTGYSILLCEPFTSVGMDALYFVMMGGIALMLGAFGSVFNTYSGLYRAKDNDLLLSMPIPVNVIMASRLLNVYLMGLMYSAVVALPSVIVYLCVTGFGAMKLAGGIALILTISLIAFVVSCLLGWVVAKVSLKVKNKSFVTVIIALAALALYYFVVFKAQEFVQQLILNAAMYGEKLDSSAHILYMFGLIGTGDALSIAVYLGGAIILTVLAWFILSRSFIDIATNEGAQAKKVYREKRVNARGTLSALYAKEMNRFTSSANYMLNCGLGLVFLPIMGVLMLVKGGDLIAALSAEFGIANSSIAMIAIAMVGLMSSMCYTAAPSVSLEGNSLWILRSMPVRTIEILRAKLLVQLTLTLPAVIFCDVCLAIAIGAGAFETVSIIVMPVLFAVFMALLGLVLGVRFANVNWTNELTPIKQGMAVFVSLFGGWLIAVAVGGLYLWQGVKIGFAAYAGLASLALIIAGAVLYMWLSKRGSRLFEAL